MGPGDEGRPGMWLQLANMRDDTPSTAGFLRRMPSRRHGILLAAVLISGSACARIAPVSPVDGAAGAVVDGGANGATADVAAGTASSSADATVGAAPTGSIPGIKWDGTYVDPQ